MTTTEPTHEHLGSTLTPGPDGGIGVLQALLGVMTDLGAVGKDAEHGQDFKYRAADAVVNATSPLFATQGLIATPYVVDYHLHTWQEQRGNRTREQALTIYTIRYTFWCVADGSQVTAQVVSMGQGLTGYSPGAAMSYGLKYVLSQALLIPFDDPKMELDSTEYRREAEASAAPVAEWWEMYGWDDPDKHTERRRALMIRLRHLPDQHRLKAKRAFAQVVFPDWRNDRNDLALWVPEDDGKPDGPGQLGQTVPRWILSQAEQWLQDHLDDAQAEAAGEEPFEVEQTPGPCRGEAG